jgi:hypothetical protein
MYKVDEKSMKIKSEKRLGSEKFNIDHYVKLTKDVG